MPQIQRYFFEEASEYHDVCIHSTLLTITTRGYLVSVPWAAQKGDRIVIFAEGEIPFTVREDSVGGKYRLIGSTYVYGMIKGKVFPSGDDALEWISLR